MSWLPNRSHDSRLRVYLLNVNLVYYLVLLSLLPATRKLEILAAFSHQWLSRSHLSLFSYNCLTSCQLSSITLESLH